MHARQLEQYRKPRPVGDSVQVGAPHRTVRGAADIHTAAKYYGNRYGNAALVGVPTAIGDTYVHVSHDRSPYVEHILTGAVSAFLALAASFLLEDRARCIRAAWTPVFG
jgi:hypothetical protein